MNTPGHMIWLIDYKNEKKKKERKKEKRLESSGFSQEILLGSPSSCTPRNHNDNIDTVNWDSFFWNMGRNNTMQKYKEWHRIDPKVTLSIRSP